MKLYDCSTAPSPRRVRVFLAEKGIEIETVQVDLGTGEQFTDEFRAINPDCLVPALVLDDGTVLTEVVAICQYFEELHPEPSLWGMDAVERARVTEWNAKIELNGLWAAAEAFRNASKGLKGRALPGPDDFEQMPELAERGRRRVELFLEKLEKQLEGRDFVTGDRFTVADISALVFVDFAMWFKVEIPGSANNLMRWHEAVSSRPSARA